MDIPLVSLVVAWSVLTGLTAQGVACSDSGERTTASAEVADRFPADAAVAVVEPDFLFATSEHWQAYAGAQSRGGGLTEERP